MIKLYKVLFFNSMILGTLISISSYSWMSAWIGLEINLLSIIPLLKNTKNKYPAEAALKYFIAQAMASSILLFTTIIFYTSTQVPQEFNTIQTILMGSSLLLKTGAAPFHFWFPEVMSGLNWMNSLIMLTWQKLAPMMLLSYLINYNIMFFSIIIIVSSMIGGIQGLNQTCMRKILAYSSINHIGWMISTLFNSTLLFMFYFMVYFIINLSIISMLKKFKIFFINQLTEIFSYKKIIKFMFMLNFLSLGGLPPFLGFLPKWLTMNFLVDNNHFTLSWMLIIFTLISLYFYLRITFASFSLSVSETLLIPLEKMNSFYFIMSLLSLLGLMICSMMYTIF
uniref:NADH-ubiquinone oxidoreductase chain 2 n=1 Tax=Leptomias sp. DX-2020 TaxID=2748276 RepID=A0A7D5IRQ6_9CUCU|nr:NADH dehydrogenase subunit 2 [Leptomias sp. DX-2020]